MSSHMQPKTAMRRTWMSRRWTSSHKPLIAVLVVSTLAMTFHGFFNHRYPVHINLGYAPSPHTITPDGLLIVNPAGPHPIFQLIRDAKEAWEAKLARASTTLDEAVAEYRRRYHRAPPRGFDKWWAYVVRHNVQLPDEYDEIYKDIAPYWGIDPAELARTQSMLETKPGLVTVTKSEHGPLEIVHSTIPPMDAYLMRTVNKTLGLLHDIERDLPPFRFSLSPYDTPVMMSDWGVKNMALEAAEKGKTLVNADLPAVTKGGWTQACAPDSPARQHLPIPASDLSNFTLHNLTETAFRPEAKSFIASHRTTMDPCMHPSLLYTHGQFLSHKEGPMPQRTLVPRFSLCSTVLHHDIRPPVPYGSVWDHLNDGDLGDEEGEGEVDDDAGLFKGDRKWDRKVDERLGWRGSTTGMFAMPESWWEYGHRARLVTLANALEGNVSILHVPARQGEGHERGEEEAVGEAEERRRGRINPAWMDIAFAGTPVGCDEEAGTCAEMEHMWEFRRLQSPHEEGRYKFIIDVDGNGWSGRFKRLITSHALIFKSTIYPEWYTSRIAPWVHYVPIQVSYSDLYDALAFFREHDRLARTIAKAGSAWSRDYWRMEDMTAYFYRLLLEYARVTSLDRTSMDYTG